MAVPCTIVGARAPSPMMARTCVSLAVPLRGRGKTPKPCALETHHDGFSWKLGGTPASPRLSTIERGTICPAWQVSISRCIWEGRYDRVSHL